MARSRIVVPPSHLRNVAIIAHVDHGKTTLVDKLVYQSGLYRNEELDKLAGGQHGLIMDSNDLERERGITILAKNCAVAYQAADGETYRINLIDTPGHADFGGEVERVLNMASGTLLLVDAYEGPMPQTRFVLQKSLDRGLKPIVVVNKVDRPDSRPQEVVNEVFDLLVDLDAPDDVLDFQVIFASARDGWATADLANPSSNLVPLFEAIVGHVPPPDKADRAREPLQFQVTSLDYSEFVGRIAIGRVHAGVIKKRQRVAVIDHLGEVTRKNVVQLLAFEGLERVEVDEVAAGDLCAVVGMEPIEIGDTIADADEPHALPHTRVDEPTLHMMFRVNDGPFSGRDGKFLTSRQIGERLERELRSNVALRVAPGPTQEQFRVSGRGMMHLGILIENMRREGFELCVGKPQVIYREIDGVRCEPIEQLVVDCPDDCQSSVMALLGDRRAEMVKMGHRSATSGFIHMEFRIPARSLMGLRSRMLNATKGQAIMHHTLLGYEPVKGELPKRQLGVLISNESGSATAYSLDALYDRGIFFVRPGEDCYLGQIVGENCRAGDLVVNVVRGKQLTNVRASGKDDNAKVRPVREMSLEACLEYIEDDELVEITPKNIRMRKALLSENDRKRESRKAAAVEV
ncbi:MAG: translational GTPase TypA [Planctomycetaceae bacterium]|uniref:Large ribosomal subunit assembly factor BipA n=1 Tax=Lacipirellula limnantheis TaxID=2528024 RepID=A0A517TTV5_9BACT|nr:translational GTPase TypA [Lacipirellula limnantheis]MBL9163300.1 translational GTPase TypA [Planctomycetaceae bacterium]QDT71812.1 GTP-binding protein TypA/BipA [Lacipirellula limnantheis]